jgi:hypothetical protein
MKCANGIEYRMFSGAILRLCLLTTTSAALADVAVQASAFNLWGALWMLVLALLYFSLWSQWKSGGMHELLPVRLLADLTKLATSATADIPRLDRLNARDASNGEGFQELANSMVKSPVSMLGRVNNATAADPANPAQSQEPPAS